MLSSKWHAPCFIQCKIYSILKLYKNKLQCLTSALFSVHMINCYFIHFLFFLKQINAAFKQKKNEVENLKAELQMKISQYSKFAEKGICRFYSFQWTALTSCSCSYLLSPLKMWYIRISFENSTLIHYYISLTSNAFILKLYVNYICRCLLCRNTIQLMAVKQWCYKPSYWWEPWRKLIFSKSIILAV